MRTYRRICFPFSLSFMSHFEREKKNLDSVYLGFVQGKKKNHTDDVESEKLTKWVY